ncbi:hypothetical protein H7H80_23770 [Mycobacterium interjectum]|nr:hypothetical protein [Mycobacterium interjectum]
MAVTTTKPDQLHSYYAAVLDARLSDYIDETIGGLKFKSATTPWRSRRSTG